MFNNYCILFFAGGTVYTAIELLFRGYTHFLMAIVGGVSLILIGLLNEKKKMNIFLQMLIGAVIITALELVTGLLFNQNFEIWDYRDLKFNFMGQICPQFSFCWFLLSWIAVKLDDFLRKEIEK